jgi:hypothetical protein
LKIESPSAIIAGVTPAGVDGLAVAEDALGVGAGAGAGAVDVDVDDLEYAAIPAAVNSVSSVSVRRATEVIRMVYWVR